MLAAMGPPAVVPFVGASGRSRAAGLALPPSCSHRPTLQTRDQGQDASSTAAAIVPVRRVAPSSLLGNRRAGFGAVRCGGRRGAGRVQAAAGQAVKDGHDTAAFDTHCPPDVKHEWWAWIMWEFWLAEGIESPLQKGRMVGIGRDRTMFRDPVVMGARIDEISQLLEMDRPTTVRLVVRAPMLPTREIDSLKTKIEQLNEVLPNSVKLKSMIRRVPTLLYKDITKNINAHINDLVELLPGYNVQKIVEDQPTLLYSDVRTTVARNLKDLRLIMPDVDMQKLVEATPSLLNTRIRRNVEPKLARLEELVGEEQMAKWFMHPVSLGRALRCSHKVIDRLEYLKMERISQRFSAITILTMTEARFCSLHPDYPAWVAEYAEPARALRVNKKEAEVSS